MRAGTQRSSVSQRRSKDKYQPFCLTVKGHVKLLRLDVINSFVAAVFMIIISVLAILPETTTLTVIGGVFGLLTAMCCIGDAVLIYRKLLLNPGGPYQKKPSHDEKQFF
ncbi:chemokine-like factor isoform X3 [Tamandua tetradactyla]|uniref:chemokine-like factor isoform X3 n=1 Tax=Tamandua tetradactyla TaxID=48850 RepID=UPI004053910B